MLHSPFLSISRPYLQMMQNCLNTFLVEAMSNNCKKELMNCMFGPKTGY